MDFGTFNVDTAGDLQAVFEIAGDLSPLPFDVLLNSTDSKLRWSDTLLAFLPRADSLQPCHMVGRC